jgi:hypothetical protein
MRDLSELNIIDGRCLSAGRPAPSNEIISAFQAEYCITLPEDYLNLLRHANGGFPELDTIVPVGRPKAADWSVSRFYHLGDDKTSGYSLWTELEAWRPILGNDALPIAEDAVGNQIFIDLKTPSAPVKVWVHEDHVEIVDLAPSFQAFIDGLRMNPDYV